MAEVSLNDTSRRSGQRAAPLRFGPFTLDMARQELRRGAEPVPLRPKTFALLEAFVRRPGQVLSKRELLETIWPDAIVTEDSLSQCIHDLRTALGADGAVLVRTVARRGYRFDAEVVEADVPAGPVLAQQDLQMAGSAAPQSPAGAVRFGSRSPALRRIGALALAVAVLAAAVHVVGSIAGAWRYKPGPGTNTVGSQPSAPRLSIVVLPLEVDPPADGGAWFSAAVSADLTAELGRGSGLVVISRDTAYSYKGKTADPRDVARELNVRYVVKGSIRRVGDDVRLLISLVDGQSGTQQWSDRFNVKRASIATAVDDVVRQVSRQLNVEVYRAEGKRAASLGPEQVQAEDLAMHGWFVWYRGLSRENVLEAWRIFEAAVTRDPRSIRAWAGIALMTGTAITAGWAPDRAAARARQTEALSHLDRLDPNDMLAYMGRIGPFWWSADFEGLLRLSTTIVERFPNNPHGYHHQGSAYLMLGRFDDCGEPLRMAIRLGPRDTYVPYTRATLALCEIFAGRSRSAVEEARLAVQSNTALIATNLILATALAQDGRRDEAQELIAANSAHEGFHTAALRRVLLGKNPALVERREWMIATLQELGAP